MASPASFFLRVVHIIYALSVFIYSCWKRLTRPSPSPLTAPRRHTPKHLALLLVTDSGTENQTPHDPILRSVLDCIDWCRVVGIEKLTVYEEHGLLLKRAQAIRDSFSDHSDEESNESEVDYPLTPPPSDYSESRPISPQPSTSVDSTIIRITDKQGEKRRNPHIDISQALSNQNSALSTPLTLCLASRGSSKPAIASIACSLASSHSRRPRKGARSGRNHTFNLSVEVLGAYLEADHGLSPPDFLIVHSLTPRHNDRTPLELHGFPPWHIRLTEICHNRFDKPFGKPRWLKPPLVPAPLDELSFRHALDEFATAEMRFVELISVTDEFDCSVAKVIQFNMKRFQKGISKIEYQVEQQYLGTYQCMPKS